MKKYFLLFLLASTAIFPQQKNAQKIIDAVIKKFDKVNDYQADITAKVDISIVKVPDTKAKIYFKQPDKIKIKSEGFAMLPKQSVNFSPAELLKGEFNTFFVKSENLNGSAVDVIKIYPNNDSSDIILSTLWIDQSTMQILKAETSGKRSGTIVIDLKYADKNYSLPSDVIFSFNMESIEMPQQDQSNQEQSRPNNRSRGRGLSGKVILKYSNYLINKGIPDSIFEEKKN